MIKNNFYPLRTIVGSSISIKGIIPFPRVAPPMQIVIRNHPNIYDAINDEVYSKYLPDIIKDGITYQPVQGMDTMPVSDSNLLPFDNIGAQGFLNILKNPSDNPFPETDSVASIYGYQEDNFIELQLNAQQQDGQELTNHFYSGRDRTYSFLILLDKEALIGGMCFNGYPFISSRIENTVEGMTVGNFGLPREMRLTPLPSFAGKSIEELTGFQRSQFIDSEFAYTRQEILSHSGLNYLTIDPVKTNLFLLTITDLPFIPKIIDLDANKDDLQNPLLIKGFKGFAIPYIYFFEYKEQTKRNARLHSGLLGVKPSYPHLPKVDGDIASEDILRRAFPEWEYYFLQEPKVKPKYTKEEIIDEITREEALLQNDPGNQQLIDNIAAFRVMLAELENAENQTGVYWAYTAHSALGQRRDFGFSYANLNYSDEVRALPAMRNKKTLTECFVSDLLQPNEKVTLYLHQGEEFERCVAGLKALFLLIPNDDKTETFAELFANLRGIGDGMNQLSDEERTFVEDALAFYLTLPPETNFCEEFRLKIYEVDPIEGISLASVDLNSKYATLLSDITVNDFMDVIFSQLLKGIPFRKTSTAKYFALEFTNTGQKAGQVAIHSLQMIRSANVSVQPRPAKTQQVKAMHYRIIGPELADDYSKLGNEGFNFSIDRVTAGQTKNVLYSAMSLLDLLHTGGARIQSNVRRRAVEEEISKSIGGVIDNYDNRINNSRITGWRQSETGQGVVGKPNWIGDNEPGDFKNLSNSENRTHNEILSPQEDVKDWKTNAMIGNALYLPFELGDNLRNIIDNFPDNPEDILLGRNKILIPTYNDVILYRGFENVWRGLVTNANINSLKVKGVKTVGSSPFGLNSVGKNILEMAEGLNNGNFMDIATNAYDILAPFLINAGGGPNIFSLAAMNSLGLGISITPIGLGISFSASGSGGQLLPSFSYSTSFGTQGNISKQAVNTGYAYSQFLNNSFDEGNSNSKGLDSKSRRIITRKEVPNTDKERVRGAEVMWQDKIQDIITGSIPLNFTLPATATKMNFRTADDSLRVRFNSGFSPSIQVDFWFELTEETIKDDN